MTGRLSSAPWKCWLLVVPALMLALAMAACDGGGGAGGETPAAKESPAAKKSPAAEETPQAQTPAAGTPAGNGDAENGAELSRLAQATEGITARVTYRFSTSAPSSGTVEGEWTFTQRPPDSRTDYTIEGEQITAINAAGKYYVCTGSGGEGQCLTVAQSQANQTASLFAPVFSTTQSLAADSESSRLVNTSERTIAGVDAKCFEVEATAATAFQSAQVCISEDGILLLSRSTTSAGEFLVEATDVSTDVGDADFEPPFAVIELPGQ